MRCSIWGVGYPKIEKLNKAKNLIALQAKKVVFANCYQTKISTSTNLLALV
jgi:hypothetical protein